MHNKIKYLSFVIVGLLLISCYLLNESHIHNCFSYTKRIITHYRDSIRMHSEDELLSEISRLKSLEPSWLSYHVIAHGGGGIDGKSCSNSREALDYAYSKGTRLFDVDINYTSDSLMVLRHSWDDNLDQGIEPHNKSLEIKHKELGHTYYRISSGGNVFDSITFYRLNIYGLYRPMSIYDLLSWMEENENAYILPDFKGEIRAQLQEILRLIPPTDSKKLKERIIVRIREFADLEQVSDLIPLTQIMLRKYNTSSNTYAEILKWCVDNKIGAVAFTREKANDKILKEFANRGIKVYVGVVDYLSDYHFYQNKVAFGVVSNFINEKQIED